MPNMKDALDQARTEAQELNKKIEEANSKNQAAIRADLQNASAQAQKLSASLKTVAENQRADAKLHVQNAMTHLDEAAKRSRDAAGANEAQLKQSYRETLDKVRTATQSLSKAVASRRATAVKA